MVRKKIDNRIRVLIENGVGAGHRTMFIVVGEKARDQVGGIFCFVWAFRQVRISFYPSTTQLYDITK